MQPYPCSEAHNSEHRLGGRSEQLSLEFSNQQATAAQVRPTIQKAQIFLHLSLWLTLGMLDSPAKSKPTADESSDENVWVKTEIYS